jgi:iron only hydrogenase large subunit-like protein
MPCIAKKGETVKKELVGYIDVVITTREYSELINTFGLDWKSLPEGKYDSFLGESSGGGAIFGVRGGVMEAALRFAHEKITSDKLWQVDFHQAHVYYSIRFLLVIIKSKLHFVLVLRQYKNC